MQWMATSIRTYDEGGQGVGGRTRGRGHHSGQGCGGRGRNNEHVHLNEEEMDIHQSEPNLDDLVAPYVLPHQDCVFASNAIGCKPLPQWWILLDSCSSANLISDKTLLHNVHQAVRRLVVHCNAGSMTLTQQGYFGSYPEPVWYNPNGLANIMSLSNVSKYYQLTMDTLSDPAILLHKSDGSNMRFV